VQPALAVGATQPGQNPAGDVAEGGGPGGGRGQSSDDQPGRPAAASADVATPPGDEGVEDRYDQPDRPAMLVRTKTHRAAPMTLDDALSNMELVGHDFYLFQDVVSGHASVVYRRRGYDYGVIHLIGPDDPEPASDEDRTPAAARF
jgi:hypothetical protein